MTLADEDAFPEIVHIFTNVDQSLDHSLVIADTVATARTPSIVKGNKVIKFGLVQMRVTMMRILKGLQCVAISHWSNGFSANEEY